MSETPTLPTNDLKSDQIKQRAHDRMSSGETQTDLSSWESDFSSNMNRWKTEVSEPPRFEKWNLETEEISNEPLWQDNELEEPVGAIERIEEAKHEPTHAERMAMSVNYLTDPQCVTDIRNTTHTLISVRQLTRG